MSLAGFALGAYAAIWVGTGVIRIAVPTVRTVELLPAGAMICLALSFGVASRMGRTGGQDAFFNTCAATAFCWTLGLPFTIGLKWVTLGVTRNRWDLLTTGIALLGGAIILAAIAHRCLVQMAARGRSEAQ